MRDRFFEKVSIPDGVDDCWLWTGCVNANGYGRIRVDGSPTNAHRASYRIHFGDVPPGMYIDHLCRNRRCVNPKHLEAVTNAENTLRGNGPTAMNLRKTQCVRGHEFDATNTGNRSAGRYCKACIRDDSARRRKENGEAVREYMRAYKRQWRIKRREAA